MGGSPKNQKQSQRNAGLPGQRANVERRKTKSITYYSVQPAHHLRLDMHAGENALLMKPMRRSLSTLPSLGSTTCPETWRTPKTPPRGLRVHAAGLYFTR